MDLIAGERTGLGRERTALSLLFLLFGMALGAWTARIPAVKQGLGLSDGRLSIALLVFALGAITGMQLVGRLIDRHGSARIMIPLALAEGVALVPPAYAPSLVTLAVALFAFGTVHGMLNIAMNAQAVALQQAWQKPIITSFHAVYSIGGFLGAAIGGLFAHARLSPGMTFLAVGGLAVALGGLAARWTRSTPASTATHSPAGTHSSAATHSSAGASASEPMPGVLFLGILAFCCLVGEGAAADWSTVYLRDSLGSTPGFAAAAYAAFAIMMMLSRLVGDRLTTAFGPVSLVRASAVLAAAGLGGALLIGHPIAAVLGFGCLGAGLACIAPQVFAAAGSRHPARAGQAIARVASLGYLGFFVGPVLIGGAAELSGLPLALTVPVVLVLFVALAAPALKPVPATTRTAPS